MPAAFLCLHTIIEHYLVNLHVIIFGANERSLTQSCVRNWLLSVGYFHRSAQTVVFAGSLSYYLYHIKLTTEWILLSSTLWAVI